MKGKSVALLLPALGCGLVASLGITQVLAKRGDPSAPSDTASVYVATGDIATGAIITPENAKIEQWPKDRVPAGAVTRQEDLDDRRTRQKIYAGEPIIDVKLLARGQVPMDGLVPKGLRVVAINVGPEAIHSGLVLPGSRCDIQVFMRPDSANGAAETLCKTILQDIRVVAVNDVTSTESKDPREPNTTSIPGGKTVSLLVTPDQAQIVTLASQMGTIRLILRSATDDEQPKTVVMTAHELLGVNGGGNRALEDPGKELEKRFQAFAEEIRRKLREDAKTDPVRASSGEEPLRYTMRVRMGAEVSDVMLINNSGVQGLPGDEGAWTATGMGPSLRTKASLDTHTKPAETGPAVVPPSATPPPKSSADSLLPPAKPGSPRSPGG